MPENGGASPRRSLIRVLCPTSKVVLSVTIEKGFENGKTMTIYAMRSSDEEEYVDKVFDSLKGGEGRFGWSYEETANLWELRERIKRSGWDSLNGNEKDCYQDFLLRLQGGDYVVYINVPQWGLCTLAKVTGEYEWRYEDGDFNHRFPVDPESVATFHRNKALVHESELARNEPDSQVHHLPRAYDDGLPSSAIRLRM